LLEALSMGTPVTGYWQGAECARLFDLYSEAGYNNQGTTSLNTPGYINMTLRQPYGVVAAIIPWNFPLLFFAQKVAPALAAGNTVVLKSSEKAPLTVSHNSPLEFGFLLIVEVYSSCWAYSRGWLPSWSA
jgi:aldehyde dehydrogenase (NAD+)